MAQPLPRLRMNLDFMPSPLEDRPGLLIRDSFQYSDATLIIPPVLVQCLTCFDGAHTELDLKAMLVEITGDLDVGGVDKHLCDCLSRAGFLHDDAYEQLKADREREFAEALVRHPAHAGSAYPADEAAVRTTLAEYMAEAPAANGRVLGIAAPHVSPFGGWESYRAGYSALTANDSGRTFIVLGTSHYGRPDRFGLTRKPFVTPYGEARTENGIVDELASEPAVLMEDYCHSVEHSIEFQVLFLQHLFGPNVKIVPVLCGSFARSIESGTLPEDNEDVRRFLGHLGEIAAREGDKLCWVLGIDMAHMGRRYGDSFTAIADQDVMVEVAERDRSRMGRMMAGDAHGFWELVRENGDDLKWCGSAPVYTFLKAVPEARGALRHYQQWNIDDQSVVSFGGMAFS